MKEMSDGHAVSQKLKSRWGVKRPGPDVIAIIK